MTKSLFFLSLCPILLGVLSVSAHEPLQNAMDDETAFKLLKASGDGNSGSLQIEKTAGRAFVRGRLRTSSEDVSTAWMAKLVLHHPGLENSVPFGPRFAVAFDLGRPGQGEESVPMVIWGLQADKKAVKLVTVAFSDATHLKVVAGETGEFEVAGVDFQKSGFVNLRLEFDIESGKFDLYLDKKSDPVLRDSPFQKGVKPVEIYQLTWGGAGVQPGSFAIDDFSASNR